MKELLIDDYLAIFKKYNVEIKQNIEAFKNHIVELVQRIKNNQKLSINFEPAIKKQISEQSYNLAKNILSEIFPESQIPEIEIFLVGTYIEMQGAKNEK